MGWGVWVSENRKLEKNRVVGVGGEIKLKENSILSRANCRQYSISRCFSQVLNVQDLHTPPPHTVFGQKSPSLIEGLFPEKVNT